MDKTEENIGSTDFFIHELARMEEAQDRRYSSLTRRITELEESSRGHIDDDPTKMIMGMMVLGMIVTILAPVIEMACKKWFSQSLPS